MQWLRTELQFGNWERSRFRFCGGESSQEYNRKSIKISMSKSAQDMEPIAVPKHVKDDLDAPMESNAHSQFRGSCIRTGILRCRLRATEALCVNGCKSLADALLAAGSAASKTFDMELSSP